MTSKSRIFIYRISIHQHQVDEVETAFDGCKQTILHFGLLFYVICQRRLRWHLAIPVDALLITLSEQFVGEILNLFRITFFSKLRDIPAESFTQTKHEKLQAAGSIQVESVPAAEKKSCCDSRKCSPVMLLISAIRSHIQIKSPAVQPDCSSSVCN